MCGLTMPQRRLMRANHRCAVVIRQVRSACSRAAQSSRLRSLCSRVVVRSAFSETASNRSLYDGWYEHMSCANDGSAQSIDLAARSMDRANPSLVHNTYTHRSTTCNRLWPFPFFVGFEKYLWRFRRRRRRSLRVQAEASMPASWNNFTIN